MSRVLANASFAYRAIGARFALRYLLRATIGRI